MALPGGRRHPADPDLVTTAVRETHEEIGLRLTVAPVGRLDDQRTHVRRVAVATYVFALDDAPPLTPDGTEAEAALWIPFTDLLHPDSAFRYRYGKIGRFPAIRHGDHVIWGLTHRILGGFTELLGHRLPAP
jgi:8-oxo-dGTP pyrophosphatase MutT (NUDIX family)